MRVKTVNIEQIHIKFRLSYLHKALNLYKIKQDFVLHIVVFSYLKIHVLVACSKKNITDTKFLLKEFCQGKEELN